MLHVPRPRSRSGSPPPPGSPRPNAQSVTFGVRRAERFPLYWPKGGRSIPCDIKREEGEPLAISKDKEEHPLQYQKGRAGQRQTKPRWSVLAGDTLALPAARNQKDAARKNKRGGLCAHCERTLSRRSVECLSLFVCAAFCWVVQQARHARHGSRTLLTLHAIILPPF